MNGKRIVTVLFLITALLAASNVSIAGARQRDDGGRRSPDKWWLDQTVATKMGLTDQQKERIDAIFRSSEANDSPLFTELAVQREQLDALVRKADAEDWAVFAAIDRVEQLRYQLARNRVFMLYRMHRCLTQEQRAVLSTMVRERRDHRQRPR